MARSYEKLGQFCDAALSIDAWVALNPGQHDTSQTRAMISNYTAKGKCPASTTTRPEVFAIRRHSNVVTLPVAINGTRGTFILDTGATYVAPQEYLRPEGQSGDRTRKALSGSTPQTGLPRASADEAKILQLGSLQAKDVPIVVQTETRGMYGDGVDGLLGMSFLSRFNVTI
mgnify:CR=1 FL=1